MDISLIVAMDRNNLIGDKNRLPWHLPADLKYFKAITMGKPIIMGRKTFESIGKPLPGRENIIITRNQDYQNDEVHIVHSLAKAIELAKTFTDTEVMIIGGAQIFEQGLTIASRIYLTQIDEQFAGDTYFPRLDSSSWRTISDEKHAPDEKNKYAYRFIVLEPI